MLFPNEEEDEIESLPLPGAWKGLKYAAARHDGFSKPYDKTYIMDSLMPGDSGDYFPPLVLLTGGDDVATTFPYLHLDSAGKACFTEQEADAAANHLHEMGSSTVSYHELPPLPSSCAKSAMSNRLISVMKPYRASATFSLVCL